MRFLEFPLRVPSYNSTTDTWVDRLFETKEEFTTYVESCFKTPGNYNLKNVKKWKETGMTYAKSCPRSGLDGGMYQKGPKGSTTYIKFWTFEKEKCQKGVIYDDMYVPGFYHFYLNFCPFMDDIRAKKSFALVHDNDLYFFHYVILAMLKGKHVGVLKARQKGYSLKIMAILFWSYLWFEGTINTIGAIDETKVKKSWLFLERYKAHCDKNTQGAFKSGPSKTKMLEWIERIELKDGGYVGNDSLIKGTTFQKSPESGVGGAQTIFFYEEAGITPTMLKTLGYITPALKKGSLMTGTIIVSGALGELEDAQDLKTIFYAPDDYDFLPVENIWDKDPLRAGKPCCLFISEAYNLEGTCPITNKPFYDENGNSDLEVTMAFIESEKEKAKLSNKASELKQLDLSQKITSPEEGFAQRKDGFFPKRILKNTEDRLVVQKPNIINCELYEDKDGLIKWGHTDRKPIDEFPFKGKADDDKRGAVQILELPRVDRGESEPAARRYFAGVDPIMTDTTTTSESLFCIYIMENITKIKYKDPETGEFKLRTEGYKIVAWYIGRYDDRKQTNEQAEYLLRLYNAYAIVENNVTSFIDHMRLKNLAPKYLMTDTEAKNIWGEDVMVESSVQRGYGIYMAPNGKLRTLIMNKIKDYVSEILDVIRTPQGETVRTIYGAERIKDIGLLRECLGYEKGMNTDRLVSFGLVLSIVEMYINTGILSEFDETEEKEEQLVRISLPKRQYFNSRRRVS